MAEVSLCDVKTMKSVLEKLPDDMIILVRGLSGETCGIEKIDSIQHLFGDHDDGEDKFLELGICEIEYNDEELVEENPRIEEVVDVPVEDVTEEETPTKADWRNLKLRTNTGKTE